MSKSKDHSDSNQTSLSEDNDDSNTNIPFTLRNPPRERSETADSSGTNDGQKSSSTRKIVKFLPAVQNKNTIVQLKNPNNVKKQLPKSTGGRPYKRFPTSPKGNLSVELYEAMAAKKEAAKQRAADLKLLREQGKGSYNKRWVDIQPREPSGRRGNSIQNRNQHEQQMARGLAQSMIDIRGHHATLVKKKEHQSSKNLMTGAACGTEAKKTKPKVMSKVKSFRNLNDPFNEHHRNQKEKVKKRPASTVNQPPTTANNGSSNTKNEKMDRPKTVPQTKDKCTTSSKPPLIYLPDLFDRGTSYDDDGDSDEFPGIYGDIFLPPPKTTDVQTSPKSHPTIDALEEDENEPDLDKQVKESKSFQPLKDTSHKETSNIVKKAKQLLKNLQEDEEFREERSSLASLSNGLGWRPIIEISRDENNVTNSPELTNFEAVFDEVLYAAVLAWAQSDTAAHYNHQTVETDYVDPEDGTTKITHKQKHFTKTDVIRPFHPEVMLQSFLQAFSTNIANRFGAENRPLSLPPKATLGARNKEKKPVSEKRQKVNEPAKHRPYSISQGLPPVTRKAKKGQKPEKSKASVKQIQNSLEQMNFPQSLEALAIARQGFETATANIPPTSTWRSINGVNIRTLDATLVLNPDEELSDDIVDGIINQMVSMIADPSVEILTSLEIQMLVGRNRDLRQGVLNSLRARLDNNPSLRRLLFVHTDGNHFRFVSINMENGLFSVFDPQLRGEVRRQLDMSFRRQMMHLRTNLRDVFQSNRIFDSNTTPTNVFEPMLMDLNDTIQIQHEDDLINCGVIALAALQLSLGLVELDSPLAEAIRQGDWNLVRLTYFHFLESIPVDDDGEGSNEIS